MKYTAYRIKITEHKTPVKVGNATNYKDIYYIAEIDDGRWIKSLKIRSMKELIKFIKEVVYL